MPRHLCEAERIILNTIPDTKPVHKTFIRRELDYHFEVNITYPILNAFLTNLTETNLITPTDTDNTYYTLTETGEQHLTTPTTDTDPITTTA